MILRTILGNPYPPSKILTLEIPAKPIVKLTPCFKEPLLIVLSPLCLTISFITADVLLGFCESLFLNCKMGG